MSNSYATYCPNEHQRRNLPLIQAAAYTASDKARAINITASERSEDREVPNSPNPDPALMW
jgi:hypothetical protein